MRRLIQVVLLSITLIMGVAHTTTAADAAAANRKACPAIAREFDRYLSTPMANYMAYKIAWRESGCVMQCVHDSDDWGCSIVGNNAGARGQYARTWVKWCGVDVRYRHSVAADVKCAVAAIRHRGLAPWR